MEEAIALMPKAPSFSPVLQNLNYIHDENLTKTEFGGSDFGGYPSLNQRFESYDIKESMTVHCGYLFLQNLTTTVYLNRFCLILTDSYSIDDRFVRGDKPGRNSGFDIDDSDLFEMDQCRDVVVASAIFGIIL